MKGKTFPKVLVAVDGSQSSNKAFQYACGLARNNEIPLHILNVIEEYVDIGHSISKELEKTSKEILNEYQVRANVLRIEICKNNTGPRIPG